MRRLMMRRFAILGVALAALAGCTGAPGAGEEQALVDRSTLAVQEILGEGNDRLNAQRLLRRARAAIICPRIFRAGFFFGGEGGGCVLVGRDAAGSWSSPAFYTLGSGSFGLQAGIQDLQVLMLVMNQKALDAVLDSQLKLGADASVAVASFGGSVEGATTAAVGGDIVAFARARGLFAGLTLEGSLLSARSEWNRAYYRQEVGPREIVVSMRAHNPGADPLRAAMMRFGSAGGTVAAAPVPAAADPGPGLVPGQTLGSGPVQRSTLPPLR
ncbi:lipid-binding SYLF domain-containing protein [Paracraurococcus lichenis]|uniref:Lipid-binding SYLF domain-containing protein n=1 Tax=Paracraurococcus lichenis TaxID=3064888 RepID=A0ABT9E2G6_9PROT|nr:lipid-binding SYLF domain-containing protein [Paracraurococcus sp. LOR1-02]MDO9710364.1 lipid-binding SYLF domain-containing protein [Paracraurococcus sp. LOR1-02]